MSEAGMQPVKAEYGMYKIAYRRQGGTVPKELSGSYHNERKAQLAIDNFYAAAKNKAKKVTLVKKK